VLIASCPGEQEVSPQLEEFINRMVNSPVKLELLLFLHNNQFTLDTALAISRRVGKDAEDVARALEELSRWNVVARQDTGGEPAYGYTQDGHVVKRIEQLAAEYLGENQYEVLSKVYAAQASRQTSQLLELRQRDSLKMQFLSLVSHELRTPLTTIKAARTPWRAWTRNSMPISARSGFAKSANRRRS